MSTENPPSAKETAGAAVSVKVVKSPYEVTMETVKSTLEAYKKAMAPNAAITTEDGLSQQLAFYRALRMIFRLEGAEFVQAWDELLQWVFAELDSSMGPRFSGRFMDKAKTMPKRERDLFERLIHLLTATADGRTRATVVRRYDFGRIYRTADDALANKIEGFYQQFL